MKLEKFLWQTQRFFERLQDVGTSRSTRMGELRGEQQSETEAS